MSFHVDAWDPSYGTSLDASEPGTGDGLDTEVETPSAQWQPIAAARMSPPSVILMVDGIRRNDARVWTSGESGMPPSPGLAASYAAGVVRCAAGQATVAAAKVERAIFTSSRNQSDVDAGGTVKYRAVCIEGAEAADLTLAANGHLQRLEQEITADVLRTLPAGGDELVIVDGPLRGAGIGGRVLGYAKTQQKQYLPADLLPVVGALAAGERTPVFRIGSTRQRYTWYLRQPGGVPIPWSGVVRLECSADLTVEQAVELANLSAATLPRFASSAIKDPRAPQQLIPIAGLEQRLRRMLGDSKLLQRALVSASAR